MNIFQQVERFLDSLTSQSKPVALDAVGVPEGAIVKFKVRRWHDGAWDEFSFLGTVTQSCAPDVWGDRWLWIEYRNQCGFDDAVWLTDNMVEEVG